MEPGTFRSVSPRYTKCPIPSCPAIVSAFTLFRVLVSYHLKLYRAMLNVIGLGSRGSNIVVCSAKVRPIASYLYENSTACLQALCYP
jgi:hypothetical protein